MANLPYKTHALIWLGDSKEELSRFPRAVKRRVGAALRIAQNGETPEIAKPLTGYGSGVYELKARGPDGTYRVVYVVKLKSGIYVIDAFAKKSKSGKAIPKEIGEKIKKRVRYAQKIDQG